MKLKCDCGHIIVDQTDNISYKGYILPDVRVDALSAVLTEAIDTLIVAIKSDNRPEWIKNNFNPPPYPIDLSDSDMIHDLLTRQLISTTQDIFECKNCGRILIQVGQTNNYKIFRPETDDTKGILNGE